MSNIKHVTLKKIPFNVKHSICHSPTNLQTQLQNSCNLQTVLYHTELYTIRLLAHTQNHVNQSHMFHTAFRKRQ